jgi:catechol 2,3-dioxygenase-like lactoylglutathione lyase family enzyme
MRHLRWILLFVTLCVPAGTYAPPTRPAVSGLNFVRLRVTNIEQARKFYGELLKLSASTSWCFRADATCYLLSPDQELEILPASGVASSNAVEAIGFWVDDVDKLRRYLTARGVKSERVVSNNSAEKCIEVRDPENHRIVFVSLSGGIASSLMSSPARVSNRIIHTGFVVHDRGAEDRFYKDLLGFHVYWHGGMKDDKDDWVGMQVPDGTDWLEYMLNVSPNADHHTIGVMNHISLGVEDIHAAERQLIANGWKPGEEPKIGRDGKWQLNLYDPDETRIEFMEFKPVQDPCCSPFTGPHPGPKP